MKYGSTLLLAIVLATVSCNREHAANTTPESKAVSGSPTSAAPAHAESQPHWNYEDKGPSQWGTLSKDWAICGNGKEQSPVDFVKTSAAAKLPSISTDFEPAELKIIHIEHEADALNNGHTIQVNYTAGDTLKVGDREFELKQYHFHAPSEHTLNGKHFPMEMHLVHQSADKRLAVIGVFIDKGDRSNAAFEPVWANLPRTKNAETHLPNVRVDIDEFLPKSQTSYRYRGSLTTPPCSENVEWIVFSQPIFLSGEQITAFTSLIDPNNRPTQPLNDRVIATDKMKATSE